MQFQSRLPRPGSLKKRRFMLRPERPGGRLPLTSSLAWAGRLAPTSTRSTAHREPRGKRSLPLHVPHARGVPSPPRRSTMSHDIHPRASVGEAPWQGLGTQLSLARAAQRDAVEPALGEQPPHGGGAHRALAHAALAHERRENQLRGSARVLAPHVADELLAHLIEHLGAARVLARLGPMTWLRKIAISSPWSFGTSSSMEASFPPPRPSRLSREVPPSHPLAPPGACPTRWAGSRAGSARRYAPGARRSRRCGRPRHSRPSAPGGCPAPSAANRPRGRPARARSRAAAACPARRPPPAAVRWARRRAPPYAPCPPPGSTARRCRCRRRPRPAAPRRPSPGTRRRPPVGRRTRRRCWRTASRCRSPGCRAARRRGRPCWRR